MKILYITVLLGLLACKQSEHIDNSIIQISSASFSNSNLSTIIKNLEQEKVSGYVLIHYKTKEYSSILKARQDTSDSKSLLKLDSDSIHLHMPLTVTDKSRYNWGSPVIFRKVLEDYGDVVKVNTTDVELLESMGHGGRGADYIYDVNTYIRKTDIIPVIKRPFRLNYKDGTNIQLDPGVAVGIPWNGNLTNRAISIQQMHFELPVPDSLLALSYFPVLKNLSNIQDKKMLEGNTQLILNGKRFTRANEIRMIRLLTPISITPMRNTTMVKLVDNGIEMELIIEGDIVEAYTPDIDKPILKPRYDSPPRWYYRMNKGTPIYWEDGRLAGKVRQYYGLASTVGPSENYHCELRNEFLENEALCFNVNDITVIDNEKSGH